MKKLSTLLLIAAVAAGIDANAAEVTRIAAGNHTMLLTKDGKIYVSGNNDAGQLGDGHYFDSEISDNHYNATTFKPVEKDGVKFRSVTATIYNSYAIASDGALYAWGQNAYGQLGLVSVGTYSGIYTPTKVDDAKWAVVKGRSTTIVGIHTDGTLWAWGKNLHGQLGVGADSETKECATTPEKVSDERWLDCASGYYHSTAVKADGTLWAWGDNSQNQVNSSTTTIFTTPQQVGEDTDWTQVQAGVKMSAALKADGSLWTWGSNEESALGRAVEGKTDGKPMKAFDKVECLRTIGIGQRRNIQRHLHADKGGRCQMGGGERPLDNNSRYSYRRHIVGMGQEPPRTTRCWRRQRDERVRNDT